MYGEKVLRVYLTGHILPLLSLGLLWSANAGASDWSPDHFQAGLYLGQRYRYEQNLPGDPGLREEQSGRRLYQGHIVVFLDFDLGSIGAVSCMLDSGELSEDTIQGGTLRNDRTEDAFFQEGAFESYFLDAKGIAFKVGQQHVVSGESYILDDFLLAGQVGLDLHRILDLPLELYGSVTRVEGSSLYLQLRAVHPFSAYEAVGLSVGWLHDTEGFLAEILEDTVSRVPNSLGEGFTFDSDADIFWVAFSAHKIVSGFRFSAVAILDAGTISWSGIDDQGRKARSDVTACGYLIDFLVARNLTDRFVLEAFYLMASGDDAPLESVRKGETLNAYVAIVPFITRLNIFFNGGINENLSTRSLGVAGHTARGFGVPGMTMRYAFREDLSIAWNGAYLFAAASAPEAASGRVYGWETDLMGTWDVGRRVRVSLEADFFLPGSFFERSGRPDPDPASRFMVGLDLYF